MGGVGSGRSLCVVRYSVIIFIGVIVWVSIGDVLGLCKVWAVFLVLLYYFTVVLCALRWQVNYVNYPVIASHGLYNLIKVIVRCFKFRIR